MSDLIYILLVVLLLMFVLSRIVVTLSENKRMVLLRLGKFESLHGPGLHVVFPFIDLPIVVNLSDHIPEWQSLPPEEVNAKVKQMVLFDPDPKKYK